MACSPGHTREHAADVDAAAPASGFAATARHAGDLAAMVVLFVGACILAGQIWRFPFDDELITLTAAERQQSIVKVAEFFLRGGDIHPPLSFLLFYVLHHLGFGEPAMRLCSVAMTASALLLFQIFTLGLMAERNKGNVSAWGRLAAVLLFGLSPLAIGQGDAIRWYPPFALLFALFFVSYTMAPRASVQLGSAVPLGLAASTNFIAALAVVSLVIYRYGLQRRFCLRFELAYWLLWLACAGLGIYSAYSIVTRKFVHVMAVEFGGGPLRAVASDLLGFFGGDALGLSQAWAVVPVALIAAVAVLAAIDRDRPANPVHLLLLSLLASLAMVLPGFGKARSFLYLAPVLAAVLTLYLDRAMVRRGAFAALAMPLVLLASVGAIANVNHGDRPFKRNAVIPYQQVLDFIRANSQGQVLIVSTDPVVPWVLRHRDEPPNGCVSRFADHPECFAAERHYDTVFTIVGHSNLSDSAPAMARLKAVLARATAGKQKIAEMDAGLDKDAALKSRLTGVPLDQHILAVDLYR